VRFEPNFAFFGRIAAIGIDVPAGIGSVEDLVEVLAVVGAGSIGLELADDLICPVDVDRQLVAEVTLAVPLDPRRIQVFPAPLRRFPVGVQGALLDQVLLVRAVVVLLGCRHERGANDLTAGFADRVLKGPDRRAAGDVKRLN
jgi:hypothetical protein